VVDPTVHFTADNVPRVENFGAIDRAKIKDDAVATTDAMIEEGISNSL
jgi:hypothetical protein